MNVVKREVVNFLKKGKECIGQEVFDSQKNKAIIIDMYTVNGSSCRVKMKYEDGVIQIRDKYHVSKGFFRKQNIFNIEEYLEKGYKKIPGFENYIINKKSECYHIGEGQYFGNKKVKTLTDFNYEIYTMYDRPRFVHRLMCETFIRKIKKGEEVNHIDGNKSNNILPNLEIVSKKVNNRKYIKFNINNLEKKIMDEYCLKMNINYKDFMNVSLKEKIRSVKNETMA